MTRDQLLALLPNPQSVVVATRGNSRSYTTPDGVYPSSTTILKVLGLSTENLMRWAVNLEREDVLEAAANVFADGVHGGPVEFIEEVKARLPAVKKHTKVMRAAGDLGTSIHHNIQDWLRTGELKTPEGPNAEPILWASMAFQDWWRQENLSLVSIEHSLWDPELGYGSTLDIVAQNPAGEAGIVDIKSGSGIYDEHHIQVASYLAAARRLAPFSWATIVQVPKNIEHPRFTAKPLGQLYNRTLTAEELMTAFRGAKMAYDMLIRKQIPTLDYV